MKHFWNRHHWNRPDENWSGWVKMGPSENEAKWKWGRVTMGLSENGAEWKWGHVSPGSKWPIIGNSPCSSKKGGKENLRTSQAITFGGFQHNLSPIVGNIYERCPHIGPVSHFRKCEMKMLLSFNVLPHMDEWSRTSLLHRCLKKQMLDFQLDRCLKKLGNHKCWIFSSVVCD